MEFFFCCFDNCKPITNVATLLTHPIPAIPTYIILNGHILLKGARVTYLSKIVLREIIS